MKKHRLEKFLSSIFGSHIDHEHSEVQEGKEEIEKKVERILKLINAEGGGENSEGGSELISLVQNFYESYQTLYGRYDHLIGKLKKSTHHKHEVNGDFSDNASSSDSESSSSESVEFPKTKKKDGLSKTNGKGHEGYIPVQDYEALQQQLESWKTKHRELEVEATSMLSKLEESQNLAADLAEREAELLALKSELQSVRESTTFLEAENGRLNQELGTSNQQKTDVNQMLRSAHEENEALISEKSLVLDRLHEAEKSIEVWKSENFMLKDHIAKLQNEVAGLKQELETAFKQGVDLKGQLAATNEEKDVLSSENVTILGKVEEAEKVIEDLKTEVNMNLKMADEKSSENARLVMDIEHLNLKLEAADQQRLCLSQELATTKEESAAFNSEILRTRTQIQEAEKTIKELRSEYEKLKADELELRDIHTNLNRELSVRNDERDALSLKHTEAVDKIRLTEEHVEMLSIDLERSKKENSQLLIDYEGLKRELETANGKVSELQRMLEVMQEEKLGLSAENETLISEKSSMSIRLCDIEKSMEELKSERDLLDDEVLGLRNVNRGLKQELETAFKQVDGLSRQISTINEEKGALSLENATVLSKMGHAEKAIEDLRNEASVNLELANEKSSENAKLVTMIEHLTHKLGAADQERIDLSQEMATAKEEICSLRSEISRTQAEIQDAEKTIKELRTDYELVKDKESKLLAVNSDLNQKLGVKDHEMDILSLKHTEAVSKIKLTEEQVEMLSIKLESLNKESAQLLIDCDGLKVELEAANCKLSERERALEVIQEEKDALSADNVAHLNKIELAEKLADDLKNEIDQVLHHKSELQLKVDDLTEALKATEEDKHTLAAENLVVSTKMQQAENDRKVVEDEVERKSKENSILQQNLTDLQCQYCDLEKRLGIKEDEVVTLQKALTETQHEASSEIKAITAHADNLQIELDLLQGQKRELEEQIRTMAVEISESKILMQKAESELTTKLSDQTAMLNEQKDSFDELTANYKLLEDQVQESCAKLEIAQVKIEELKVKEEIIHRLEIVSEGQKRDISMLEKDHKELLERLGNIETEKVNVEKENARLHGQVETLEVQLRLSNRKLKITETEHKEKDESNLRRIQELLEERSKLEEQVVSLYGKMHHMENELVQIKEDLEIQLARLTDGFQNLEFIFEEKCGIFQSQLSECSEELQVVKESSVALLSKKLGLEHEKHELDVRLKYKEGIVSMLKEEAGSLVVKLAAKTTQEERLTEMTAQYEKKLHELEKRVKEKEEEGFFKDEEKREAIRQLCLLIDYHRENYHCLYQMLPANMKRIKRSA